MRSASLTIAVLAGVIFSSGAVRAQESGTIIINPDGTVTESDAADPMARHNAARAKVIKAEKINPPEPDAPKPVMKLESEPQPTPEPVKVKAPVKKPVAPKAADPATEQAAPAKAVAPKAVKPKKKAPAQEKTIAEKSPKIKWNKSPKKKPKPVAIETAPVPAPVAPTGPISREEALRAAIQVAPPFKRSTVLPGNVNGRPVYQVILQTEDGEQDILVDTTTGEIVH